MITRKTFHNDICSFIEIIGSKTTATTITKKTGQMRTDLSVL